MQVQDLVYYLTAVADSSINRFHKRNIYAVLSIQRISLPYTRKCFLDSILSITNEIQNRGGGGIFYFSMISSSKKVFNQTLIWRKHEICKLLPNCKTLHISYIQTFILHIYIFHIYKYTCYYQIYLKNPVFLQYQFGSLEENCDMWSNLNAYLQRICNHSEVSNDLLHL